MSIIRKKKYDKPFVQVEKEIFNREDVTLQAKGLFGLLMTLPDDWQIYLSDLHKRSKNGRDGTATALNELIKLGYIRRMKKTNTKGQFKGYDYEIRETLADNWETVNVKAVNGKPEYGKADTTNKESNLINNNTNKENKKGVPPSADDVFYNKLSKIELPKKLEKFRAEISACIEAGYLNYNKYSDFKMKKLIKAAYDILEQHGSSKLKACLKISTDNGWQSISIDYIKKSRGKKTDGLNSLPVEQRQNGVAEAWKAAAEQDESLTIFTF